MAVATIDGQPATVEPSVSTQQLTMPLRDRTFMHRVVMEEGTGNWCQFCVQGIEEIRYMKDNHPEDFIAIAIHSGDFM